MGAGMRARARGLFAGMLPLAIAATVFGAPPAQGATGPGIISTEPGIISTEAGGPGRGLVHNVAQEANWVATAPDGSVYVSDVQGVVRQFNDTSTWEKAIAGLGQVIGYGGAGGAAAPGPPGRSAAAAAAAPPTTHTRHTPHHPLPPRSTA